MSSHNKRRNSALMYEFLVKHVTKCLVAGDKSSSNRALKLLKKYYKPGTEIYKEFRLINSLAGTHVSTQAVAASILTEAKSAAQRSDVRSLDAEKTALLHEVNRTIKDHDFYDQPIANYRQLATLQSLVNHWRGSSPLDISKLAEYEDSTYSTLLSPPASHDPVAAMSESKGTNRLLMRVMLRKFNEKYRGVLTEDQQKLLKAYATSSDSSTALHHMTQLKEKVVSLIDSHVRSDSSEYTRKKLLEVRSAIVATEPAATDECFANFMLYAKLKSELESEG